MASDIGLNLYIFDKPTTEEPEERAPESPNIKSRTAPWKSATEYFDETLVGKPPADPDGGLGDSDQAPTAKGGWAWRQKMQDSAVARWHGLKLVKRLGGSLVSTVYLAVEVETAEKVVVKVMNWSQVPGQYQRSVYLQLMKVYDTIPKHPNIVRPLKRIVDGHNYFLVFDWCRNGSLATALGPTGMYFRGVAENHGRKITKQICEGLHFLMKNNLPHGRLTLENVLLDADFKVMLCDYGYPPSTCKTDDDFHLRYRPPEFVQGRPYTAYVADMWSLGVVLYSMLHGHMPYSVNDMRTAGKSINLPPLEFRASLSLPCQQMVKRLLTYSPLVRPTLAATMKDKWLTTTPTRTSKLHPACQRDHDECQPEANANTTGQSLPSPHSNVSPSASRKSSDHAGPPGTGLASAGYSARMAPSSSWSAYSPTSRFAESARPMSVPPSPFPTPSSSPPPPLPPPPLPPSQQPQPLTGAGESAGLTGATTAKTAAQKEADVAEGEDWPLQFLCSNITSSIGRTYALPPLCPKAVDMHKNQSLQKHLCWRCYYKQYSIDDAELNKPWITECHRGRKMCPRIASMFTHYRAVPPNHILKNPPPSEKEMDSASAALQHRINQLTAPPMHQIKEQLMNFLKYSERMRAKFYRYHACVIPPSCKEYPLPPLIIWSFNSKTGRGRT